MILRAFFAFLAIGCLVRAIESPTKWERLGGCICAVFCIVQVAWSQNKDKER